ncbi:tetratricopeptide repeat protein [Myxococcota bacterium]|nr:tetratricopeptide repeat protein [Myxococcota bacterium]
MSSGQADSVARHASVTELELAFAQNPESTAYVDLCLAYIEQGRFMEAMVVCKKGIKAHPESIDGRVLLARVYAAQKKYKRALQELDELVASKPDSAEALVARAKLRVESGEDAGVVDDLKKAVDLDPKLEEPKKLLADRGIEYPERPKAPEPPPPPPVPAIPYAATGPMLHPQAAYGAPAFGGHTPALPSPALPYGAPEITLVPPMRPGSVVDPRVADPRGASSLAPPPPPPDVGDGQALARGASVVPGAYPPGYPYPPQGYGAPSVLPYPMPQRLEGEEELEALANKVAEERPDKGKPKTSLFLGIALAVLGVAIAGYRVMEKRRIEAIDQLTQDATAAFNQDTYGSYKSAAGYFEQILNRHDSRHALTLGRLAHVYAILWGEHGETKLKEQLDQALAQAEKHAPEVSHTVAARGLALLYDGKDRQANAAKAREVLAPVVQKVKEVDGAPSYADLTLAIADLELGEYDEATQTLGNVKQVLPGSVRAKVWHARAAFRANRLGTAEAAFMEALRAQPGHPGARAGLALVKLMRGDLNSAAESIVKFDELPQKEISDRDRALAEFARSQVLRAAGEDSKAVYDMAVRYDPGNADFPFGLGRSLLDADRAKEALPHLKKAVEMEKTRTLFLITLAEAEMRVDDYDAAKAHIEDALKKAPTSLEAALAKARLYRRTKNAETETYLAKVLQEWPSAESDVNLELGRYYRALGRLDDAKASLEKAIEKMGGSSPAKQGDIVLSYAKLMKDRSEDDVALKSFRQAAELGNIEAWFRIIEMLGRSSDKELKAEAKRACDRYLAAGASLSYSADARELCDQLR